MQDVSIVEFVVFNIEDMHNAEDFISEIETQSRN